MAHLARAVFPGLSHHLGSADCLRELEQRYDRTLKLAKRGGGEG
jgi:hypothetical protein